MLWNDLKEKQPKLEQRAQELLILPGVMLIGTIRTDGTPRISPVEPLLVDGELRLSMLYGSMKAKDLRRDPRILVQNIVTNRDGESGEFRIRGKATETSDSELVERYAQAAKQSFGWSPAPGQFHLFSVDIESISYIRYEDGDQYSTSWPGGGEQIRRKNTPTSLHPPESTQQLLK